jgi:hypothetical protein
MNPALRLLLFVPADVPGIPAGVEGSIGLATLSHRESQRLDGRRVRVRVDLESLPGDGGGAVVYDCVSPDDVTRTVWLVPGQEAKDVMDVGGVFRLLWGLPGNGFPGYWEFRVEGAVRRPGRSKMEAGIREYLAFLAELVIGLLIAFVLWTVQAGRFPEQTERDEFTARNRDPDESE